MRPLFAGCTLLPLLISGCSWITADEFADRLDLDNDGHAALDYGGEDCDDDDADVHPGATERCNGIDDDCDDDVDELPECGGTTPTTSDTGTPTVPDPCLEGPELYGESEDCPVASCAELLALRPELTDDAYLITAGTYAPQSLWCDMTTDGGGWTRIYAADYLYDDCPSSWVEDAFDPALCIRPDPTPLVQLFGSQGVAWTELQVRATLYQWGQPDAFIDSAATDPAQPYVDGMAIMGDDPGGPVHAFTYAVGASQDPLLGPNQVCPYQGGFAAPGFVGLDSVCASAQPGIALQQTWASTSLFDDAPFLSELPVDPDDREVVVNLFSYREGPPDTEDVGVRRLELSVR